MRVLVPALAQHLASDATTLCYCWRIERRDGAKFGFTDHDRNLTFDGVTFLATAGITTSKMVQRLGLSVDNLELEGAIDDDALTVEEIERGLYDDAKVALYAVNWQDVGARHILASGTFGNVTQADGGFAVEFRSLAHILNQPMGRVYGRSCDAKLGDDRCRYAVTPQTAEVVYAAGHTIVVETLPQDDGWFSLGVLKDAQGGLHAIKSHKQATLYLWERPVILPTVGQVVTLTPGCRGDIATCKAKFNNVANFRGFPTMPGNDALIDYPVRGRDDYKGGSLFGGNRGTPSDRPGIER